MQRAQFPGFFNAAPGLVLQRYKGYWCGINSCPDSYVAPQWQEQFLAARESCFFFSLF